MGKYMIKRILIAIPVLIGITIIDYAIMCLAGSPLQMLQGPRISQAAVAAKEIALGLDKPFYVQYFVWLKQLLHGNMGYSIKSYQAVSEMIASHLGPTLLLMGVSLLVSLLMAVPAGIYSAIKQYSAGDYTVVTLSFLGSSVPGFFLSLLLIYLFTVKLGWLPSSGMATLGTAGGAGDVAKHMVMPVLVLATSMAGTNIRYIRSAMLEILQQDYLRTAKAKGIGRFLVINKHALRNALIPIITVIGMEIPVLFGGQVIIEQVFSWPGLGLMTMSAITNRDYPVIMGVCLLSAIVVLAAKPGAHQVRQQRAADSLDLVGGDGDADAGRAGEDAHVTFAGGNSFRRRRGKVGIVAARLVEAAKILDLIALFRQMGFDGFLQVVCAVVAGKSDFHVGFSFVVMVFCYIISGAQRFCKRQPRKICQNMPMRRDQSFAYASSLTGSHHSFLHSVPGTSTAMWLNQLSRFAPCQCLTLAGIVMTVPGWRLTAGCPSS